METTTIKLGDGSNICDKCIPVHYPDMEEPTFGWQEAECDYCRQTENREKEIENENC